MTSVFQFSGGCTSRRFVSNSWATCITCDKPLQTFLNEKGKLDLKEMTQAANNYVEERG